MKRSKVSVSQSGSPSVASEEGRKSGINHSGGHLDSGPLDNIDIETILPLMRGYPHADTELSQNTSSCVAEKLISHFVFK